MHFCSKCDNMYYIRVSDEEDTNKLIYYCRNCGDENQALTSENIFVSRTQLSGAEKKYGNVVNKYTKLDPTLPRINTIKCPNPTCNSNTKEGEKDREVIYMRYDDINMKYVYLCSECDTTWRINENS